VPVQSIDTIFEIMQLILRKFSKTDATRCQILRLKCTKFAFCWGSAPDPAGGAYSAPQNPLAVFKGPTVKNVFNKHPKAVMLWTG